MTMKVLQRANNTFHRRRRQRGTALGFALSVLLIASILTATAIPFTFSHLSLAHTEKRNVDALYLMDAGVNYELQRINQGAAYDVVPRTITFDNNRSVTVSAQPDPFVSNKFTIQATVNDQGVPRTAQVSIQGLDVLGAGPTRGWVLFGINTLTLGPFLQVDSSSLPAGTTGTAVIDPSLNLTNRFYLAGSTASANAPFNTYPRLPFKPAFPGVDTLANQLASRLSGMAMSGQQGMEWLKTHNDNAYILDAAGSSLMVAVANHNYVLDGNVSSTMVLKNPYGDGGTANFYVEGLDITGSATLIIDNTNGPIAVWVGQSGLGTPPPANLNSANIIVQVKKLGTDGVSIGRIYHNGAQPLNLTLAGSVYCGIYAVRADVTGTVCLNGSGSLTGSVIAANLTWNGVGGTVLYPQPTGLKKADPRQPAGFLGIVNWTEVTQ